MGRFIALLLVGPCLAVLAWLYWLYVRKAHAAPGMARRDALWLVAAFAASVFGALAAWQFALGHGGPIWKYLAGPIGAYIAFNLVLAAGLLRHWHARRSLHAPASTQEPAVIAAGGNRAER